MLIENYALETHTGSCGPSPERHAVLARLTTDISEVLPYLDAALRGASYYPGSQALIWKNAGYRLAIRAHEVVISDVEDRPTAEAELEAAVDLINRTWERRAEITPDTSTRQRPTAMAVFKLLPRTNGRQCGEPACFTFAGKLVVGLRRLANCPTLAESS